jgi:hypothetical protein
VRGFKNPERVELRGKGKYSTLSGLPSIGIISPDFIRSYSNSIPSGFLKDVNQLHSNTPLK